MDDYISREAVNALIKAECSPKVAAYLIDAVATIHAADVRPVVRGRWICGDSWSEGCGMGESYGFYYKCSVCKDVVQGGYKECGMNYCPNCGADMRPEAPKEE